MIVPRMLRGYDAWPTPARMILPPRATAATQSSIPAGSPEESTAMSAPWPSERDDGAVRYGYEFGVGARAGVAGAPFLAAEVFPARPAVPAGTTAGAGVDGHQLPHGARGHAFANSHDASAELMPHDRLHEAESPRRARRFVLVQIRAANAAVGDAQL